MPPILEILQKKIKISLSNIEATTNQILIPSRKKLEKDERILYALWFTVKEVHLISKNDFT